MPRRALHCVLDGGQTISSRLAQTVLFHVAMSSYVLHHFTACCMLYSASAFACESMASGMQKQMLLLIGMLELLERQLRLIPRFPNFAKQNIGSARFCRLAGDVHSRCIRFNIHDLHLPQILFGKARQLLLQISLTPRLSKSASNTVVFARINDAWRCTWEAWKAELCWNRDRWTRKSLHQHLLIPLYIFSYFLVTSKVTGL